MTPDIEALLARLDAHRSYSSGDAQVCVAAAAALRELQNALDRSVSLVGKQGVQLATQAATIEGLRKDAERYRYVRDHPNIVQDPDIPYWLVREQIDAAIDAALAADKPQHSVTDSIDSPQEPLKP